MRRVPQATGAIATVTAATTPLSSTTAAASAAIVSVSARPISFFGWKPYGGSKDKKGGAEGGEGEGNGDDDNGSISVREMIKRRTSFTFKENGKMSEEAIRELHSRGGAVEMVSDDIPVRNLPPATGDVDVSADWSKREVGSDAAPTAAASSSSSPPSETAAATSDELVTTSNKHSSSSSSDDRVATLSNADASGSVESFDSFRSSTLTFKSKIDPDALVGVGMGAGFGEIEDKRLGFLRPSKKGDRARTKEEEEEWMQEQKRLGLMDPEEGDTFLDGSVYRPSKTGLQGLKLLNENTEKVYAAVDRRNKEKYDAIDKALREGKFMDDKVVTSAQVNDALTAIQNEEMAAQQQNAANKNFGSLEAFNAERSYALARSDAERTAIRERQRRLAQLQLASALKRMSDWRGTTFSTKEHFLLVDLDYDKDSLLFGRTREEFEENVRKMKKVVVEYTRWERGEYLYKYGTWFLKFAAFMLLFEIYQTRKARNMLIENYDDFTTIVAESINELEAKRIADIDRAIEEIKIRPPDFKPLKASIEEERKRLRAERALLIKEEEIAEELERRERVILEQRMAALLARRTTEDEKVNNSNTTTSKENLSKVEAEANRLREKAMEAASVRRALEANPITAASAINTAAINSASSKRHPLDTTGVEYAKNAKEMEDLKDALFKADALSAQISKVSPDAGLSPNASLSSSSSSSNSSFGSSALLGAASVMNKYLFFGGIRNYFNSADHKVSSSSSPPSSSSSATAAAAAPTAVDELSAVANGIMNANSSDNANKAKTAATSPPPQQQQKKKKLQPLTKQEEDERILASMTYGVSPTSIEAVKALRKILLPRTEDFITIVRQEMLAYREHKKDEVIFPGSNAQQQQQQAQVKTTR